MGHTEHLISLKNDQAKTGSESAETIVIFMNILIIITFSYFYHTVLCMAYVIGRKFEKGNRSW